jgi:hypothetical protein
LIPGQGAPAARLFPEEKPEKGGQPGPVSIGPSKKPADNLKQKIPEVIF